MCGVDRRGMSTCDSIWGGLRPLVTSPETINGSRLATVTGGKWTSHRFMAEDAMGRRFDNGVLPAQVADKTPPHAVWVCGRMACYPLHALPRLFYLSMGPRGPRGYKPARR